MISYLMVKWDRRLGVYHAYLNECKFIGQYESKYLLYEEAKSLGVNLVIELHKTRTVVGNPPTYDEFLSLIADILNPKRGGQYFQVDVSTRWGAFKKCYNEFKEWLNLTYPNLIGKIEKVITEYLYTFCTDDALRRMNGEIQLKCQ